MDEDKIIMAVLDLGERVEKMREEMATKSDIRAVRDVQEHHTTIMKNIQEDHTFSIEWLKRLQDSTDKHSDEIQMLKTRFNLA